jgi:hypothetical protein
MAAFLAFVLSRHAAEGSAWRATTKGVRRKRKRAKPSNQLTREIKLLKETIHFICMQMLRCA